MTLSVSDQCRSCIAILQEVISAPPHPDRSGNNAINLLMREELDRFSLFVGNIGALHQPESPMSIESRLQRAHDVLAHILGLLDDLKEVTGELLDIVSGKREGFVSVVDGTDDECGREISEDHREKLADPLNHHGKSGGSAYKPQIPNIKQSLGSKPTLDRESLPSFFTKATTIATENLAPELNFADESDPDDARSYTTISRSMDGDHEACSNVRIPKLDSLRTDYGKEFECPFCFRIKKFKSERVWKKHVFSDLRPYVCTFPDCDSPYFGDINKWFQHEMTFHRVSFECFLCSKFFNQEDKYTLHIKREHDETLDDGGEQAARDLSRKPLAQIPATDCPCCSDWSTRLEEQVIQTSGSAPTGILAVTPTVFKRHLAGHLEQLALFAIPIGVSTDANDDSNAAMEETKSKRTDASKLSALTFPSDRGDLERSESESEIDESGGILHADIQPSESNTSAGMKYRVFGKKTREKIEQLERLTALAEALSRSGTWRDAHALYSHVIETSKRKFGSEHHNTVRSKTGQKTAFKDYSQFFAAEENRLRTSGLEEADNLYNRCLELQRKKYGCYHQSMLPVARRWALMLARQAKFVEAETIYKDVIKGYKKTPGNDDQGLLWFEHSLASLLVGQGRYEEAELLCRQLLSIYQEKDWHQTEEAFLVRETLVEVLAYQEKHDEADFQFMELSQLCLEKLQEDHKKVQRLITHEQYEAAEDVCQEALLVFRGNFGIGDGDLVPLLRELGIALVHQQKLEEAENAFRKALKIYEQPSQKMDAIMPDVMGRLVDVLEMQGRLEEVEDMRLRMLEVLEILEAQDARAVEVAREVQTAREARAVLKMRELIP
ncbi:hypothetical protein PSV08DRAFT_185568 [Bipolaris maydis]|uniref:uncharacterized protein n=1 Tax=Cochliobolus heterostrophus TaxID=5016 RepID=UPI0024D32EE1|nr:hypothetical protein J3E73DRAFT_194197 [Bipolaris maydis]KAJ6268569.1 hypothetical protein PSV08DRAFT_185568 [Bipolaris maydis]KAJ6278814.1 hypothetical protein J3E71DRAFT_183439 [Bipolaris maydis]